MLIDVANRAITNRAVSTRRVPLAGVLMLGMASLVWADKVTEVSADFLEYLGSLEGDDDNWTALTPDAPAVREPSAASAASSSSSSAARKTDNKDTATVPHAVPANPAPTKVTP